MKEYALRAMPRAESKIDYANELNPQQLEVVQAGDGPILVIAGAGSGKTRTITYRVARLLERGVPPAELLLLTFTNRAAREMLRRVEALLGADVRRITGGTFHHAGNLVLRKFGDLVGLRPDFTILDREDSKALMEDVVARNPLLTRYKKYPKGDSMLEIFSYAANTETPVSTVIVEKYPVFFEVQDQVVRAFEAYRERKRKLNLVDFDDLLVSWRDLVRDHPDARGRWKHILVDEYQDTNRIQAQIVETIAGPGGNLTVVGDDAQSIYSFRGANFENIIDFPRRFPGCRMFKLETNYRSVPEILALANDSIAHNERQFPKVLRAHRAAGAKPERVSCGDPGEQARFVAQRMLDLREEGLELRDMAVLYRAHWHSMELQMELTRLGIPFQVRSGLRFFEQAHIKDVISYLKIVENPRDEMAWKRVLRLYPRIGTTTAGKLWEKISALGDPLRDLAQVDPPVAARRGWADCVGLLLSLETMKSAPSMMIQAVVKGGYESHLITTFANFTARLDDLRRLADFALQYDALEPLLSELALTNGVSGQESLDEPEDTDQVILSTVHQAKGLEWRAVFVLWLVDGKLPDGRAVTEPGGEEEERRLFYVAATRAKDYLWLAHPLLADERNLLGVLQRPSRFLSEIGRDTYEEVRVT